MKKKNAQLEMSREVRTYGDLYHGAHVLISKDGTEGSFFTTMGALLLLAFTVEAYLNHLGEKIIPFWNEIDSIRVLDKLTVICKQVGIAPNMSCRPFQTLAPLFKFRNSVAHGQTKIVIESKQVSPDHDLSDAALLSTWEEYCTIQNAERASDDVTAVLEALHEKSGLEHQLFISGNAEYVVSYEEAQQGVEGSTSSPSTRTRP